MRTFIYKAVASAVGLGFGVASFAQSDAQPIAGSVDKQQPEEASLAQVVVTVQRRNEILSQTPIAASVLSGKELAEKGVTTAEALQFVSPSVAVNNFGQGVEFNIRGIGKAEMSALNTTGVITYRDGVPSFPGFFQGEPYYDVSNIQILRGPQGTVVGQNSTGGAVFVNTNNPIIGGERNGYVSGSAGNYGAVGVQGAINLPISDTLAARIAFLDEKKNSFYKITGLNGAPYLGNPGNSHQRAARVSFLLEPNDKLSVLLKTDVNDLDMGAYVASKSPSQDLFNVTANSPQEARDRFFRHNLKAEYVLDSGTKLRSVTGYSEGTSKWVGDFNGSASSLSPYFAQNPTIASKTRETQVSQEFNIISSDAERMTWLLGAFAISNSYDFPNSSDKFTINYDYPTFILPDSRYQFSGNLTQKSQALFGQIGYQITPDVKFDIGARNTASNSKNNLSINQLGFPINQNQSVDERNTSYKISLGWKVDPNNFVYVTESTGFKPGGVNLQTFPASPSTFNKEEIKSLELGWKSAFAGGKGGLKVAAFYNEYDGFQVSTGSPTGGIWPVIANAAGTTKIKGIEAETNYKIGGWTLGAGLGLADSSMGRFYAVDGRLISSLSPGPQCNPDGGSSSPLCVNLSGKQLSYAPRITYNLSAKYEMPILDGKLTTMANFGHVDSQWATLFQNASSGDSLAARNILNAQLTYQQGKTSVTAYGTNLTNQHYVAAHWLASGSSLDFAGPPRQIGIKVSQVF